MSDSELKSRFDSIKNSLDILTSKIDNLTINSIDKNDLEVLKAIIGDVMAAVLNN